MTTSTQPPFDRDAAVLTEAHMTERWREIVGHDGFGTRSLSLICFDADGRQLPVVVPVDDIPARPDDRLVDGVLEVVGGVLAGQAPGGYAAVALNRPGAHTITSDDRAWSRAPHATARDAGIALRPLHLATRNAVHALRPDDLV